MKLQYTFLLLLIAVLSSCTAPSINEEEALFEDNRMIIASASIVEAELLQLVNNHREAIGLSTLELSEEANMYADEHNDHMIAKGKISHDNFNARASNIANETGATVIKENVAKSYTTAEKALNGWLNSQSHKNTIEGGFTHTGISVKADVEGKLYYTQLFFKK